MNKSHITSCEIKFVLASLAHPIISYERPAVKLCQARSCDKRTNKSLHITLNGSQLMSGHKSAFIDTPYKFNLYRWNFHKVLIKVEHMLLGYKQDNADGVTLDVGNVDGNGYL